MNTFLSYASEDKAVAESIAFSLRGRGHKVFLDRDNLPPGGSYDQQIESAVNDSDVFVFLVSPDSVAHGRYSLTELTFARHKWPDPNGRVLPVMVRNTPLEDVPPYLRAVSLLEPIGNITAEASSAVDNMRAIKRSSDEGSVQYLNALGLGIVAVVTFVFIAVAVEHPIVNGWDILGLAVPFYIAIITYAVFSWLDNNASDEATKVISAWLHGRSQNKPDLGNLIINAFDRIYTSPLLTFRAFFRSAVISMIVWLLMYAVPWLITFLPKDSVMRNLPSTDLFVGLVYTLRFIVLSDYVSLFVVRRFLALARAHPIKACVGASIVGFLIIMMIWYLLAATLIGLVALIGLDAAPSLHHPSPQVEHFIILEEIIGQHLEGGSFLGTLAPALIIHLWLPLFALSSLAVRLVFLMFRAVEGAQWFLKQGDAHPFKAIGIVATIIVFGSAILVKEAWTIL